jgi:hypothetical protein
MEKKDIEEVKKLLLEINGVVSQLDPLIKVPALEILTSRFLADVPSPKLEQSHGSPKKEKESAQPSDTNDLGGFISAFDNKKPKDNVMLLVAWLYSTHGVFPITAKDITNLADSCGLIIPSRSDNTMRQAKSSGKNLFNQQGKGWQLTVSGEMFI